jgi:hypothetical protein
MSENMSKRNSGKTGPTSVVGLAASSENSTTRGCRSQRLLVKGEKQEDLDAMRAKWMDQFKPYNFVLTLLVEEIIRADWMLERARRNETIVVERLAEKDPDSWEKADHDRAQLFARYVKSADNTFHRAMRAFREMQKHDAYLRDREEERALSLLRAREKQLVRVQKRHQASDLRPQERKVEEFREYIQDKYSPIDDYLPDEDAINESQPGPSSDLQKI